MTWTWNGEPIHIDHVRPPIPTTAFDYSAMLKRDYDNMDLDSRAPVGWGASPEIAAAELLGNYILHSPDARAVD